MTRRRGHGEGSISKRADGRWEARVDLGWRNGKRQRKVLYGRTRREVAEKLTTALSTVQEGGTVAPESLTVAAYLADWLDTVKASIRPRTWQRYESYVRLHATPVIGKVKLTRMTPDHLQGLYQNRLAAGLSPQTVVHLHRMLHTAFKRAVRFNLAQRNVADLLVREDLPRVARREMRTLSAEQVRRLLAAARGDQLEALYVLAITMGMGEGELLGLRWADVDLAGSMVTVRCALVRTPENRLEVAETKTDESVASLVLAPSAVTALRAHRVRQAEERLALGDGWDDHGLVFPNGVGRPMNPSNLLRRHFHPLLERAGLPRIRFHDLRHSTATLLLERNVPTRVVSDLLRHSDTAITQNLYQHLTPTMSGQAVLVLEDVVRDDRDPLVVNLAVNPGCEAPGSTALGS
jgi:integrase